MNSMTKQTAIVRKLGLVDYETSWRLMQQFTDLRDKQTADELWVLQHPAVFTLGQAGKQEHLLDPGEIPVLHVDRGGQVTYHGPGQLVVYILADLRRLRIGVRELVTILEESVVALLARFDIAAQARADAPGVYVPQGKIAALGLRVRRGCSFHGLALNIDADLSPFARINPCGYPGMAVTRLCDLLHIPPDYEFITQELLAELQGRLGYNRLEYLNTFPELG